MEALAELDRLNLEPAIKAQVSTLILALTENSHYVDCPVMNSGITASMAAAVLSRRSHAQALHN